MEIAAADPAPLDGDDHLARAGDRFLAVYHLESAVLAEGYGAHCCC